MPRHPAPFDRDQLAAATRLEPAEAAALRSLSDGFVQEAVHMSRHYSGVASVDARHWKKTAHCRGLTQFRERRPWNRSRRGYKLGSRLAACSSSSSSSSSNTELLPATLLVGSFPGDLESVMYALQGVTDDDTRLRAAYLGDGLVHERVLSLLESPSFQDPLRTCTLRWRGLRTASKWLGSHRPETVYMEATGLTRLSNGERVGYELLHSVELPGVSSAQCYPARISYCYVYRQPSPDVMEVFMLGSTSSDGVLLGGAWAKMQALQRVVRCAERKKLAWLLGARQPTLACAQGGGCCAECFRSLARWPSRAGRTCSACDERVCAGCVGWRKLCFALPWRAKVARAKLPFCGRCLQRAEDTSAVTVAAYETLERSDDDSLTVSGSCASLQWASHGPDDCKKVVWHPADDDLAMTILGD